MTVPFHRLTALALVLGLAFGFSVGAVFVGAQSASAGPCINGKCY